MADLYFSTLGSAGGDGSQLDPYENLTQCLAAASNDDVIEGADGSYIEPAWVAITRDGLTIQAENSNQAIITQDTSTTRVLHCTKTDLTLDGIVLDAQDTIRWCFSTGTTAELNITINGGTLLNPTESFLNSIWHKNFTMNGGWLATANSLTLNGFTLSSSLANSGTGGLTSISDGAMNIANHSAAGKAAITVSSATLAEVSCEIYSLDITLGLTGSNVEQVGILVKDTASSNIYSNTVTLTDSLTGSGIIHEISTIDDTDVCNIYLNTLSGVVGASGGRGIHCGSNDNPTPTGANSLKNARVFSNTVNGFNHGVFVGWITDARMYANKVSNTVLGCVAKSTATCKITGNVVIDNTGDGCFLAKGDTDSDFANNLAITNVGATTISMIAGRVNITDDSTGTKWTNNILFNNGGTVTKFVNYSASQTATFVNNNYYSNDAIPANSWVYAGANVADFTAWAAHAQTTGELNVDPEITGLVSSDYLARSASLLSGGANWGEEMYLSEDFNGYPFPAFDISVGAVQGVDIIYNPFACPNL